MIRTCDRNTLGYVYALNSSGALQWRAATGSGVYSSPRVSRDGKWVYVGSDGGAVVKLDANDGAVIWRYDTGGAVYSKPLVGEYGVYFGSVDGYFYSILDTKPS